MKVTWVKRGVFILYVALLFSAIPRPYSYFHVVIPGPLTDIPNEACWKEQKTKKASFLAYTHFQKTPHVTTHYAIVCALFLALFWIGIRFVNAPNKAKKRVNIIALCIMFFVCMVYLKCYIQTFYYPYLQYRKTVNPENCLPLNVEIYPYNQSKA